MNFTFLRTGAAFMGLAVLLGAFAAHGLKKILPDTAITIFNTGVTYQFYHAIAILITGIVWEKASRQKMKWAFYFFVTGILLFSGSLYLLAYLQGKNLSIGAAGIITPIGGICFLAGWVLFLTGLKKNQTF